MAGSTRQAGHTGANLVTVCYLLAAVADVAANRPSGEPSWLLVHLLLLGAATNAIITWSWYFVGTFLHQPTPGRRPAVGRLAALNVAIVGVMIGVTQSWRACTFAAAALLTLVIAIHLVSITRTVHAGRAQRFAPTVRFYSAAAGTLLLGIAGGTALVQGSLPATSYAQVYATHVHLNLLGWVTLTVLGTEFILWPTALRTRMVDGLERAAGWALPGCCTGLLLTVAGLLAWVRPLAIAGLALFLVGVVVSLDPFVRTALRRPPHDPATAMMAASTGWLLAGLVLDAVYLGRDSEAAAFAGDLSTLLPWLIIGFVVQVLLGALTYLGPVLLGGAPSMRRRTAAELNRWGRARLALLNVGALLLALTGDDLHRIGWLLIAAALASFAVLAAAMVWRRFQPVA